MDTSRLSPEHQDYIRKILARNEQYKKPKKSKKAKPVAYGIEFDSPLEASFADELVVWKHKGLIDDWRHHPIKVSLAAGCWYTPDFSALHTATGHYALYEVKGSWKQKGGRDSRTRLKIAASLYPQWMWYGVTRPNDDWAIETISHVTQEAEPME
jgi:hypothetical protein